MISLTINGYVLVPDSILVVFLFLFLFFSFLFFFFSNLIEIP